MSASLDEMHSVLADLLRVFDDVCRSQGLRYYLFYGTLLGAIRHRGFIPWDDDADVVMPREDYMRLLSLPKTLFAPGYFLQTPWSEKKWAVCICKVKARWHDLHLS